MQKLTTEQRFEIVSTFIYVMRAIRDKSAKSIEKIRRFIPTHTIKFSIVDNTTEDTNIVERYFAPLDFTHKGKRRIYTSMCNTRLPLYMIYISKHELDRLDRKTQAEGGWISNMAGDRWFVVANGYKFKNAFQLINSTVAFERTPTKGNHPSEGGSDKWKCSIEFVKEIARYRSVLPIRHVYGVSIKKFSITEET